METVLGVTKAREKLSEIVESVQYRSDAYIISRYGRPAAAVVPVEVRNVSMILRHFFA